MLSRIGLVVAFTISAMAVAGPAAAGGSDDPSGGVTCPVTLPVCVVTVEKPATSAEPASRRKSGNKPACAIPDELLGAGDSMPCYDKNFGSWNNADGCYYKLASPQPPQSDPIWEGHTTGAIYESVCFGFEGTGGGPVWRATAPTGVAAVTPEELAQQAVKLLPIHGPDIGIAPEPGKQGLVGLPVWMWTTVTPATWGPATATATVPSLSVTATAKATKIVWRMGDGSSVACTGPGTPYDASKGDAESPDCGHVYDTSSAGQPDDAYRVTATTTWQVAWVGGGAAGELTTTRTSVAETQIGEMQVLIT